MKNTSKTKEHISGKLGKVFVGLSGGVDSAVSAALLKDAGYDVTGVFIRVWQPDNTDCGWKDERRDAMRVAATLDIGFVTLDLSDVYKKEVADYMISEYSKGRTPNPDVMCNRFVKFGSFWEYAKSCGADYIATGHYARSVFNTKKNIFEMLEGKDASKDQTYFLWTLTSADLAHVLFPIGHLQKKEVRELAACFKLPVSSKKDSQGVCFIGQLDMKEFLKSQIHTTPGNVLNIDGEVIGSHDGAVLYTIGERHGFTIQNKDTESVPRYVIAKDIQSNTITVANDAEACVQAKEGDERELTLLERVNLPEDTRAYISENTNYSLECRIRYRQKRQKCKLLYQDKQYYVQFEEAQKGLALGQSVVFYIGEHCLGGGILSA